MGEGAMTLIGSGKNRIMIFGPKDDGTYVVEFRRVASEALGAIKTESDSLIESTCGTRTARKSLSIWPASRILILQWQPIAQRACAGPVRLSQFGKARRFSRTAESGV
jgi:hypothetical protein